MLNVFMTIMAIWVIPMSYGYGAEPPMIDDVADSPGTKESTLLGMTHEPHFTVTFMVEALNVS